LRIIALSCLFVVFKEITKTKKPNLHIFEKINQARYKSNLDSDACGPQWSYKSYISVFDSAFQICFPTSG